MEISKTLRPPSSWQDFENLCKVLWGEIWNCSEIKKNGRNGQEQCGVDVYGIPKGESEYYGIQCKGKDEYSNKKFTEKEIEVEISKALKFKPKLKKLYFATTALKDVKIEEFVREKNIEHIAKGIFEVHIFSWEDIVDLIDENKRSHDYYVKSINYKANKAVKITFQNNSDELIITPKFKQVIRRKVQRIIYPDLTTSASLDAMLAMQRELNQLRNPLFQSGIFAKTKINHSYCILNLVIHNVGDDPIEEFKLLTEIKGEVSDVDEDNKVDSPLKILSLNNYKPTVQIIKDDLLINVIPVEKILVGDDVYESNYFYIKPKPENYEIEINWKLISKDFKDDGVLKLFVKPYIERSESTEYVESISELGVIEGEIEDFISEDDEEEKDDFKLL